MAENRLMLVPVRWLPARNLVFSMKSGESNDETPEAPKTISRKENGEADYSTADYCVMSFPGASDENEFGEF